MRYRGERCRKLWVSGKSNRYAKWRISADRSEVSGPSIAPSRRDGEFDARVQVPGACARKGEEREVRMVMQCRMCSQRLTRPGKLCHECDRELARARSLTASTEGLAAMPLPLDPSAIEIQDSLAWTSRLTSRTALVVGAFVMGSALAAAL